MKRRISTIAIANRGEIAVRIARTIRKLGGRSLLTCHRLDADSPAARECDGTAILSGADPLSAYLDARQIVEIAREAGADAIHPGYGFLSENASFAELATEAGLVFIGPSPEAIRLMGDKIGSRDFVRDHGFRVAPSVTEEEAPDSFLERVCELPFPVVIKASAGGGGKGMHIVRDRDELEATAALGRREAERYFGDGRIYAERYIDRARHIEVQVLADHHGNCVHLFERECSIQRRFQKLAEESPAPNLPPGLRERICAEALGIARAAKYSNAGTVEFVLAPDGEFYFLEMNTRLQVEHPVTEMVTGLDLVEQQIRVASGELLSYSQEDVVCHGAAIECRICAEEPENDFMPAIGKLALVRPAAGSGIRFDGGIASGQTVTTSFDPMLGKLVTHGATREDALERMRSALSATVVLGVATNTSYLRNLISHPAFEKGDVHTDFVRTHADSLREPPLQDAERRAVLAAAALSNRGFRERIAAVPQPYASIGGWRN